MKTLFMVIWILLVAACAFAAGDIAAAQESPFSAFMTNTVQPAVLSVLAMIIGVAVTYLTALLKRKFGLEISTSVQQRINTVAYDAVHAVEEKAAASLAITGQRWASESKHTAAINYILGQVPTLSREEADAKINTALAMIKGMGATREIGV